MEFNEINPEVLNIAEGLPEEVLNEIGTQIKAGYETDEESRQQWMDDNESWLKLATQYKEEKSFPWPNAANVKYPLVQTAAMQFSARAYPALVPNKKPVKTAIIGKENAQVNELASRIGDHMNYQIMYEMDDWEEDMDRLCIILPISGTCFKKTYHDPVEGKNISDLILPRDLVVNYWTKTIETAPRITHIVELDPNEVESRKRRGVFLDIDYGSPTIDATDNKRAATTKQEKPSKQDWTTPYVFLECHTRWDIDNDGYAEPYIITIEKNSAKVARIVARYHVDGIEWNEDKSEIIEIEPIHYFTKFGFIPNPDGGFYDMGFGLILGPLNETINTSLNQLIDAGTLSTLQAGFLGKGLRIRGGEYRLQPNEWKVAGGNVEDLRKQIFPLPVKEPSTVLFQLLGMLVQSGKELASIAEIFVGKMPGQNTPATTTMESVKQGMAVFTAIYKRIYRSLDKEYKKLFTLNKLYLDSDVSYPVDLPKEVYGEANLTVMPTADPDAASDAEKLVKATAVDQLADKGRVNPQVATRMILEAMRMDNIDELLNFQPPQDPEATKMQLEAQIKQQDADTKKALAEHKAQLDQQKAMNENALRAKEIEWREKEHEQKMRHEEQMANLELAIAERLGEIKLAIADMTGAMKHIQEQQALELSREKGEQDIELKKKQKEIASQESNKTD